jgi:hypothetical protein
VTAATEIDAYLCHEEVPDEFCRFASSSPPSDHTSTVSLFSGLVPSKDEDGVMCPLMLRRRLVVPAFGSLASVSRSLRF